MRYAKPNRAIYANKRKQTRKPGFHKGIRGEKPFSRQVTDQIDGTMDGVKEWLESNKRSITDQVVRQFGRATLSAILTVVSPAILSILGVPALTEPTKTIVETMVKKVFDI
jgi:hypothetical protein